MKGRTAQTKSGGPVMSDVIDVIDELSVARHFVECAYLACHELPKEHANPLCAVLDAASTKLKEVDLALSNFAEAKIRP